MAAILLPQPAPTPSLTPVTRLMLEARVTANLLFPAAAWDAQPAAARAAAVIAAGAPARTLAFRPDASWIDVVAAIE